MKPLTYDQRALVVANLKIVRGVVRKQARFAGGQVFDDLFQAGALGLMHAATTFDPARGSFFSHAYPYVLGAVFKAQRDLHNPVKATERSFETEPVTEETAGVVVPDLDSGLDAVRWDRMARAAVEARLLAQIPEGRPGPSPACLRAKAIRNVDVFWRMTFGGELRAYAKKGITKEATTTANRRVRAAFEAVCEDFRRAAA